MKIETILFIAFLLVAGIIVIKEVEKRKKPLPTTTPENASSFDKEDTRAYNKMRSLLSAETIPLDAIVSRAYSSGRYEISGKPSKALAFFEEFKKLGIFNKTPILEEMQGYFNEFNVSAMSL